ncbi:MAG: DUF1631 family protein [Pseudomonadota bacterium]
MSIGESTESARGGADQRAYARLPVRLPAEVMLGRATAGRSGEIRDFCRGGMYFAAEFSEQTVSDLQGLPATVRFSLEEDGAKRGYVLQARIARSFLGGLGLAFVDADPNAIRALQHHAEAYQKRAKAGGPRHARRDAVLNDCKSLTQTHLRPLFDAFLNRAEKDLLAKAREVTLSSEQTKLFDALNTLEKARGKLATRFESLLDEHFEQLGEPLAAVERPPEPKDGGLTLVDQSDFEEFLTVSELVARAEPVYEGVLFDVQRRLANLHGAPIDGETNPVGPLAVYHALRAGLADIEVDHVAVEAFFTTYQEVVVDHLHSFYAALNELLEENGFSTDPLPGSEKKPGAARPPKRKAPEPETPPALDADEMLDLPGMDPSGVAPGGPAQGAVPQGSGAPGIPMGAGGAQRQTSMPRGGPTTTGAPGGAPLGGAVQPGVPGGDGFAGGLSPSSGGDGGGSGGGADWLDDFDVPWGAPAPGGVVDNAALEPRVPGGPTGIAPVFAPGGHVGGYVGGHIGGAAKSLFGLARRYAQATPGQPGAAALRKAEPAGPRYSSDDVLTTLDRVAAALPPMGVSGERPALRSLLVDALAADPGGRTLSSDMTDALELVEGLFDAFQADDDLDEVLKPRVSRLEPAVQRAAIVGAQFFTDVDHPVRGFINGLAELNPSAGHDSDAILSGVDRVLDRVAESYLNDASAFETALGQLRVHLDAQRAAIEAEVARVVKMSEDQQSFVRKRRGAGATKDSEQTRTSVTREWELWLERARRMAVGSEIVVTDQPNTSRQKLVWIGDDFSSFVFVDRAGNKSATMSLPELAMQLRRGLVVAYESPTLPLVERSLYAVLHNVHRRIERRATHDQATGLAKRKTFERRLEALYRRAIQTHRDCGLVWLHVPGLGGANEESRDNFGQAVDSILNGLPDGATAGLMDATSVAIAVPDMAVDKLQGAAGRWPRTLADVVPSEDPIGVAVTPLSAGLESLNVAFDSAADAAERAAGDSADAVPLVEDAADDVMDWETLVERTLGEDRLQLRFQRIGSLTDADARPLFELLLGLRDDDGQSIPAREFVKAVEYHGQAAALDRWVFRNALRWMKDERRTVRKSGGFLLKLTGSSLEDDNLAEYLLGQLTESGVPPGKVIIEITESDALSHIAQASRLIRALGEFGCRFVLDKFASGQESHEQLKDLPVEFVKIEGRFVVDLLKDQDNLAVVHSITELARALGVATIAEFVENEFTLIELMRMGVDLAQGHYIEEPRYIENIAESEAIELPDVQSLQDFDPESTITL